MADEFVLTFTLREQDAYEEVDLITRVETMDGVYTRCHTSITQNCRLEGILHLTPQTQFSLSWATTTLLSTRKLDLRQLQADMFTEALILACMEGMSAVTA